jgi:hypothetical protein
MKTQDRIIGIMKMGTPVIMHIFQYPSRTSKKEAGIGHSHEMGHVF